MKKTTLIFLMALALAACSEDVAGPTAEDSALLDEVAGLSYSGSFVADPGVRVVPFVLRLPDNLKLSAAQEASIKALLSAFAQSTRADHEALAAINKQAREAIRAGKTREEVRAILEQGNPIRLRLEAAEKKLHDDVMAVLTPEQRAWLESHKPTRCQAPPLTEAQKTQISALIAGFEQANKADLDAIKAAFEQARAAARNGAPRDQVRAILDGVKPAADRVRAAEVELAKAILALLTPEQALCRLGLTRMPQQPRVRS